MKSMLVYEPTQQMIIFYMKPREGIYFTNPELASKVGVGESQIKMGVHNMLSLNSLRIPCKYLCFFSANVNQLMLYSNIVSPSFVGNSKSPIMRTIDVSCEKFKGETIHHNYTDSQYYMCSNGDLTYIEVQLRDLVGREAHIHQGITTIVINIRPIAKQLQILY